MSDELYKAKQRLLADLVRAKDALQNASTPYLARQATATVEGTRMLLEALDRKLLGPDRDLS